MENVSYTDKVNQYKQQLNEVEEQLNRLKIESQVTDNEIKRLLNELKESGIDISGIEDLDIVKVDIQKEIEELEKKLHTLKSGEEG